MKPSATIFEVFIPQYYSRLEFKRTDKSFVLTRVHRDEDRVTVEHYKRTPPHRHTQKQLAIDFETVMSMWSVKAEL